MNEQMMRSGQDWHRDPMWSRQGQMVPAPERLSDVVEALHGFARRHPIALLSVGIFAGLILARYYWTSGSGPSQYYASHPDRMGDAMGRASSQPAGMRNSGGGSQSQYYGRHQDEIGEAMGSTSS